MLVPLAVAAVLVAVLTKSLNTRGSDLDFASRDRVAKNRR